MFVHLQGSDSSDPLGENRSLEFNSDGSLKIVIGRNKDQEESLREDRAGRTTQVFGRDDNLDQVSINQITNGKIKKTIGYNDTDKISYDITANGSIKATVGADAVNQRSIELDTSNGWNIKINNADATGKAINLDATGDVNLKVTGKKDEEITLDVTETYGGDQLTKVTGEKRSNAAGLKLDGEGSSGSGTLGGIVCELNICPITGLARNVTGSPGSGFSTNVKCSKE